MLSAEVAQLVVWLPCKQQVLGSNPSFGFLERWCIRLSSGGGIWNTRQSQTLLLRVQIPLGEFFKKYCPRNRQMKHLFAYYRCKVFGKASCMGIAFIAIAPSCIIFCMHRSFLTFQIPVAESIGVCIKCGQIGGFTGEPQPEELAE